MFDSHDHPVVISNGEEDILYIPPPASSPIPSRRSSLSSSSLPFPHSFQTLNGTGLTSGITQPRFPTRPQLPPVILTIYCQVRWCIKYSWLAEQMAATLDQYGCVFICLCILNNSYILYSYFLILEYNSNFFFTSSLAVKPRLLSQKSF